MCRHIVSVQTTERYLGCKHRFRLAVNGNKFQSASFRIQKGGPLLIAECPEIRLSSIHRDRETGLAILRAAFSQRGDCQSAYGVL